ncbi:MAG: peptidylprolyl isomerase [Bacteroidetes bacterium]|nr:peptidylprolyl isomerase [Bacteroidota bacterium]
MLTLQRNWCVALVSLVVVTASVSAQKAKKPAAAPKATSMSGLPTTVLATVGTEKVTYGEVERAFQKNMNRRLTALNAVPKDTALEFLRLYTNYRLKVQDAKDRGMDKDSLVRRDIESNRKLLSETYFFDKKIADARIDELARRRTKELQIGIILCNVTVNGSGDSTLSVNKANRIIAMLNAGANFEQLAKDSSDDQETGRKGGTLPFLTGGTIIKSVEDAVYAMKVGEHSKTPVTTRYGAFVAKVYREEPREMIKARHILLTPKEGRDTAATIALADSLVQVLNRTNSETLFAQLAEKFSDDKTSGAKGGSMGGYYSRSSGIDANGSKLTPDFEAAMFALKDGQVSQKPLKTLFGWHIVRRDSSKMPDLIAERDQAKRIYRRIFFEGDKRALLDSLKNVWKYGWTEPAYSQFVASVDTNKNTTDTGWVKSIPFALMQQNVYHSPRVNYTVEQFADSLRRRLDMRGYTLNRAGFERGMNKMTDPYVIEQATEGLEKQYPDFAALMQEFHDGILLFKVEEQEVWSKLKFDTADARVYFDSTRSRWMTEPRYLVTEIYLLNEATANDLRGRIAKGEDIAELAKQYTERDAMREKSGLTGPLSAKTSKLAEKVRDLNLLQGSIAGPFAMDKGYSIVRLERIEQPRQKTFDEAITELAPSYQDQLQKRLQEQWLSRVRAKHPVKIETANVNRIWTK